MRLSSGLASCAEPGWPASAYLAAIPSTLGASIRYRDPVSFPSLFHVKQSDRLRTTNLRAGLCPESSLPAGRGLILCLLLLVMVMGCGSPAIGWAGVTGGDTLYLGSMGGRVLALNPMSRRERQVFPDTARGEWQFPQGDQRLTGLYATPLLAGDVLYAGSYEGRVYALEATTGAERWRYPREGAIGPIVGGLALSGGMLYFGDADHKVYGLEAAKGELRWSFPTGEKVWGAPVVEGDTLYIGSLDHKLYALDATTGRKRWEFATEGAIASTPLVSGGRVYFGSFDNRFYALDTRDGREIWRFEGAGNWFWTQALLVGETLYIGSLDHKLYALEATTGRPRWPSPFMAQGLIRTPPIIVEGVLVTASNDGNLYGLDPETGRERWQEVALGAPILAPLHASAGTIYVMTTAQVLYALEAQTGNKLWDFSIKR